MRRGQACGAIVLAVTLASCAAPSAAPAETAAAPGAPRFGWVEGRCLVVQAPLETLPQSVWIAADKPGAALVEAKVVSPVNAASANAAAACNALHPDRAQANIASGHVFYTLELAQPADLAVVSLQAPAGSKRAYDVCFTSEGVRFTASQGERVVWEDYYYLGYDVEPTCK